MKVHGPRPPGADPQTDVGRPAQLEEDARQAHLGDRVRGGHCGRPPHPPLGQLLRGVPGRLHARVLPRV